LALVYLKAEALWRRRLKKRPFDAKYRPHVSLKAAFAHNFNAFY
jgi:hypothetical protein